MAKIKYRLRPGDEIDFVAAGDVIRVLPPGQTASAEHREARLHLFDQATARQRARKSATRIQTSTNRGWKREDLYRRGRSR